MLQHDYISFYACFASMILSENQGLNMNVTYNTADNGELN